MKINFAILLITFSSIFSGLGGLVEAQTLSTRNKESPLPKKPIVIKLEREKLGRIPTIAVNIKGKNYTFFYDSGAAITSVSPEIAKAVGCEPFGQITGYDAGGGAHKMKRCDDIEMNIGGFSATLDVTVGDAMIYFPKGTPQIDGIVSLQTFENQTITMDLAKNELWIESKKSLKKRIAEMKPLESRLSRELGGYGVDLFLAVQSAKGKVWLLLDTGNTNKLLLAPHAQEQLGITLDKSKEKEAKPVNLELIGYGSIDALAREREMIYDGMLNYDTILKMLLTIDLRDGKAWAKENSQKP